MTRAAAALVVLSAGWAWGCSRPAPPAAAPSLDQRYTSAVDALRQGELERALQLTDEGIAAAARAPAPVAARFRLLKAEVFLFRRAPADAAPFLADTLPSSPEFAWLRARQQYLAGQRSLVEGRVADALVELEQAGRTARAAGARDVALDADVMRGQVLARERRWSDAVTLLEHAAAEAEREGDRYRLMVAWHNRGMASLTRGRFDEAVPFFDRVLTVTDLASYTVHDTALTNAALCYARLGEYERAIETLRVAVERHQRRKSAVYLGQALGELGSTYVVQGEYAKAIPYLEQALQSAREAGRQDDVALWSGNLASAYLEQRRWDEAERMSDEARRLPADARNQPYLALFDARILEGRGRYQDATAGYQRAALLGKDDPQVRWRVLARLGLMAQAQGQRAAAVRHFEQALTVVERARSGLVDPNRRLSIQMRLAELYYQYVDVLIADGQNERALSVADSGRAVVLSERQGGSAPPRGDPGAFRRLMKRIDSVAVFYSFGDVHSFAWIVTPEAIRLVPLDVTADDVASLVEGYRRVVVDAVADPLALSDSPGHRLFAKVMAPVLRDSPAGRRVIVVPDGALRTVNLEALPVPGARPHYLIEDVEIAVAPSLGTLLQAVAPRRSGAGLLLIGDAVSQDTRYPALRYASAEVGAISRAFPQRATVLRGRDASPMAYRTANLSNFGVVHFTAHAEANPDSPLDSAVILSKGADSAYKLYASDVIERPLRADLVTISACRSAGERTYAGDGLVGFAWAFLRAGAHRVIAGLWDVDDASTADLMTRLYGSMADGQSPSSALRAAKLAMIAGGGVTAKPYYWAPFQLFVGAGLVP